MKNYVDGLAGMPAKLKAARVAAGLSMRQAANKAGISDYVIVYCERERNPKYVNVTTLAKLCDAYNVDMDDLF